MFDYSKISLEELEFNLPLDIQLKEKKEMPCADCEKVCEITVTYVQNIWRSDTYFDNDKTKKRSYEISFRKNHDPQKILFRTARHHNLRNALIEAHKKLDEVWYTENKKRGKI